MKMNMGIEDRWVRALIGIVIAAVGIYYQSWWGLVAIVPLATAAIRVCPMYLPFGLSTIRK